MKPYKLTRFRPGHYTVQRRDDSEVLGWVWRAYGGWWESDWSWDVYGNSHCTRADAIDELWRLQ